MHCYAVVSGSVVEGGVPDDLFAFALGLFEHLLEGFLCVVLALLEIFGAFGFGLD